MKAVVISAPGLDHLEVVERPDPQPGPREVLVRLRAASLNYRDLVVVTGGYGSQQKRGGLIPLSDGAGEVVAVGEGVAEFRVGDRVMSCFFQDWEGGRPTGARFASALGALLDGVACEYRVFPERGLVRVPDYLDWHQAATLPCAALTAWSALTEAQTRPGDVVVTQGTGGVSLFAVQLAAVFGARVIATSSTDAKLDRVRALGAHALINYTAEPEWGQRVRALTGGDGADVVVEIGGAQTLKQSIRAVRVGGAVCLIGVVSGGRSELLLGPVVTQYIRLLGITVGSRERSVELVRAMTAHGIQPVIDRVFPLSELGAALAHLQSGRHVGKICIAI